MSTSKVVLCFYRVSYSYRACECGISILVHFAVGFVAKYVDLRSRGVVLAERLGTG
jgi:hypothetical protein